MNKKGIIIIGATSSIAQAVAKRFAKAGNPLYLASRDESELERIAKDLEVRYEIDAAYGFFTIDDLASHETFLHHAIDRMNGLDGLISVVGYMGDQMRAIRSVPLTEKILLRNFTGVCSLLTHTANYLEKQKRGFIIGITSAAGIRGKQSNYIYGAAKGGLHIFLQGLRNRLYPSGVHVMTAVPGFIDTAMTYGMKLPLIASPEVAGEAIYKGLAKKKDIVYVPWFWRYILLVIQCIPEPLFKRLKL